MNSPDRLRALLAQSRQSLGHILPVAEEALPEALLGLRGLVFKSHGSADELGFGFALTRAYDAARNDLLQQVQARIARAAPLLGSTESDVLPESSPALSA